MSRFNDKTYLIIGATSGIGSTLSKRLLAEGANTWLVSRDVEKMQILFSDFSNAKCLKCDLMNSEEIERLFITLTDRKISFDGLVFCSGLSPLMRIDETDIKVLKETFQVNVISFIEVLKWFLSEKVSKDGASIVVMSSVAANIASYRQTVYASTKAALEEAVRCAAKEAITRKIRVNAVSAGAVDTPMLGKLMEQSTSLREKLEKLYPLGLITTDQVASQILFLLSECGANTTGSVINIDSGFLIYK